MPRSRRGFVREAIHPRTTPGCPAVFCPVGVVRLKTRLRGVAALVVLLCFTMATAKPAVADEPDPANASSTPMVPTSVAPTTPSPAPTAAGLDTGAAPAEPPPRSLFDHWWFWTVVGVVASATVAVVVLSSRGPAPPATDLGNQEFGR